MALDCIVLLPARLRVNRDDSTACITPVGLTPRRFAGDVVATVRLLRISLAGGTRLPSPFQHQRVKLLEAHAIVLFADGHRLATCLAPLVETIGQWAGDQLGFLVFVAIDVHGALALAAFDFDRKVCEIERIPAFALRLT